MIAKDQAVIKQAIKQVIKYLEKVQAAHQMHFLQFSKFQNHNI